jgi:hypothetical protein
VISFRAVRSHPFLIRLVLASLGTLVLGLGAYIGLGFVVRARPPWVDNMLGRERVLALQMSYIRALGGLFPNDNDGDFIPDAVEVYVRSNPESSFSHSPTMLINHEWAFETEWRRNGLEIDEFSSSYPAFLFHPGERRRIRARLVNLDGQRMTYSPEMQLGLSGGLVPPAIPEIVSIARDGAVEFEVAIAEDIVLPNRAPGVFRPTKMVMLIDPVTRDQYGHFLIDVVWRQPPIACVVAENPPIPRTHPGMVASDRHPTLVRLTWTPPPPGAADMLYIEAARAGGEGNKSGEGWFAVACCQPESRDCVLSYRDWAYLRSSGKGALKFRVVPAKWPPADR